MRSREVECVFCLTGCEEKGIQVRRLESFAYCWGSVLNRREMLGERGGWCPESGKPLGVKVKEVMLGAAQDGSDSDCMVMKGSS